MYGSIVLNNFRCFQNLRVTFKNKRGTITPQVFIYGANATGKTSFLYAFAFLKRSFDSLVSLRSHALCSKTKYTHNLIPFSFRDEAKRHHRVFTIEPMSLAFEIHIDGSTYIYEIVIDRYQEIVSEALLKKVNQKLIVIFEATSNGFNFGRGMILKEDYAIFQHYFDRFFGQHTMLSILNVVSEYQSDDVTIKDTLNKFIVFVRMSHLDVNPYYNHQDVFNGMFDADIHALKGEVNDIAKHAFEQMNPSIESVVKALFPNIHAAQYRFKQKSEDLWTYEFEVTKNVNGGLFTVPSQDLPRGTKSLLAHSFGLFDAYIGRSYISDDFDRDFQSQLMMQLIEHFIPRTEGQLILTLSNPQTMNAAHPSSVYVASVSPEGIHAIECIEDIAPTQANHNVRSRYEQGVYGHIHEPNLKMFGNVDTGQRDWIHDTLETLYEND